MSTLYLLWDDSHIWGLLLQRALANFGLPHALVTGRELASGLLEDRPPAALLVPGGNAKRKQEALGAEGVAAVQSYVKGGGAYIGFCGGAGLGLSGQCGLGLCPWQRRGFADRMQHFVSGHMVVKPAADTDLLPEDLPRRPMVPVWWPARFEPQSDPEVRVLAEYQAAGPDFWIADLPLRDFPTSTLKDLESRFKLEVEPRFMTGQPVLVEGSYGQGRYLLSYSHLETPASRDANLWLAHVLSVMAGLEAIPSKRARVPAWPLDDLEHRWPEGSGGGLLLRAREVLAEVIALGESHLLFFRRNPWLLGWRRGIPGMNVNSLYALACRASNIEPTEAAGDHLASMAKEFSEILEDFRHGLTGYLLAERLAMTMSESANPIPGRELQEERAALFGPPMQAGGLCGELQSRLEELVRLGLNTRH